MSTDARGIPRGQCQTCSCGAYSGGNKGLKCLDCGHPPGKHENLSSSASLAKQTPFPTASLLPRPAPRLPVPFTTGPQCQLPGCMREAHFDLNSSTQYSFCRDHMDASGLMNTMHLDYGEPMSYYAHPTYPPVATPVPSIPSHYTTPPSLAASQSTPNLPFLVALPFGSPPQKTAQNRGPSPVPLQHAMQPLQPPGPPLPQPQLPPSIPPDQQCKLKGCTRPRYVESGGRVHDCCGRTHARQYAMQQSSTSVPEGMRCKTAGCIRPRRKMDNGSGYYDFCSLSCRDDGPSVPLSEGGTCSLLGCNRPKYVDPANNRVHDFCGRTHAFLAQKQGIPPTLDNVGIKVAAAGSQEFTSVSGKFQQAWAKGSCPPVSFIFIINNRQLQQRWIAYRQKLSDQTMEECYHGTQLLCDITSNNGMCNNEECGICGISRTGMDRRCIRKNINFQRFGHGFYVAPNSSKCHDYTQGAHGYRAMLLCDVCPGRKYIKKRNDENLRGPPQGFDSIYGQSGSDSVLNYDEVVLYNPDSVLPRYVVVYQKDGTYKIAK